MKKRFLTVFLLSALLLALFTASAYAEEKGARLIDNADLLTNSEESAILSRLDSVSEKHQYDIVILTEKSIGSKSPRDYADDYYDYNGYGFDKKHSGLLLLITFDDEGGIWWISTCGEAIDAFTDDNIDTIGELMSSDLGDKDYKSAFDTFIDECDYYIDGHINGFPFKTVRNLIISLVIGVIVAFIAVSSMKSQLKSVAFRKNATSYIKQGSMKVTESRDFFLYSNISRTARPKDSGSSSHRSSSGRSHGGGGGRF